MRKALAAGIALVVLAALAIWNVPSWGAIPAGNPPPESVLTVGGATLLAPTPDLIPPPESAPTIGGGAFLAPTPGLVAMTIYAVTNQNAREIEVRHIITDTNLFRYEFSSIVPAGSTVEYHLRDILDVPSPFSGAMTLQSRQPFTATVTGYDYAPAPPASGTPISLLKRGD